MNATQSKNWPLFVNLYRTVHWTNAGLEHTHKFSEKDLKSCIKKFKAILKLRGE